MSTTAALAGWPGLIAAYADRVAIPPGAKVVTLLEGGTPLVPADTLSDRVGAQVYLKVEGANPTGSFKDRGMTVAVTHALASGARAVICASTGNTSASAAAYAARAGLTSAVLVPQGKIAPANSPRRSPTAPGSCRSRATSTTASSWPARPRRHTRRSRWSTR